MSGADCSSTTNDGIARPRPCHEQTPRSRGQKLVRRGIAAGQRKRRHGHFPLPADAQGGAAGGQHGRPRRLSRDLRDLRRGIDDLFDIVQDEQQVLRPQKAGDLAPLILSRELAQTQRLGNGRDGIRRPA